MPDLMRENYAEGDVAELEAADSNPLIQSSDKETGSFWRGPRGRKGEWEGDQFVWWGVGS